MEHIFYYPCLPAPGLWVPVPGLWVPAPGLWVPAVLFMGRILSAPPSFPVGLKNGFSSFSRFIFKFKHSFAIQTRASAKFHPNLISKIPCSKGLNLPVFPSALLKKRKCFYDSFQKVCAQFHPSSPVHFCDLSTKTQKKLHKFHFITKIPGFRG
jgi:hypothetical protein